MKRSKDMKRFSLCGITLLLLSFTFASQAAEIQIKPERLNPNGKKPRMKVVIRDVDPESVSTDSITLNGLTPIKTKVNPNKVTAFFYKNDVVATLGDVQKGQVVSLDVAFSIGNAPATHLTDEVKIVGKKATIPDKPEVPDIPTDQRPL